GYTFLGATTKNGDQCGASAGTLQWATGKWDGSGGDQKLTVHTGDPARYKLYDDDIVVIAFLPTGKTIAGIGNPPSLRYLPRPLGLEPRAPGWTPPAASTP